MLVYLINIVITLALGSIAMATLNYGKSDKQYGEKKVAFFFVLAILTSWVLIYALRDNVGSDFSGYQYFYQRIGKLNQSFQDVIGEQRDFLFATIEYCCYKMFRGSWIGFSTVLAILTYFPILITLREKSVNFVVSAGLYIFMMNFYAGFNGVRQAIAVSLVFYAYYVLFQNKKYWKYTLIIAVAFGFHSTVLFVIPFHLLSLKKVNSRLFKSVVVIMLFGYMFMWNLWMYLIEFLELIGQNKLADDYADAVANGSSYLRLAVYLLPVVVALVFYKQISNRYQNVDCEIMFMIVSAIFMLFSTKYWLFARVASYFSISTILFVPKLGCIFTKNSKKVGMLLILGMYFLFMYSMLLHGEGGYYPYRMMEF